MYRSGIFTQDGADWAHSRALLRPQFTRGQVSHLELLEPHVQDLMRVLPIGSLDWTEPVDLSTNFFNLTLDTASDFLFGESVYSQRRGLHHQTSSEKDGEVENDDSFADAFETAQHHVVRRFKVPYQQWIAADSEFTNACRQAHEYVDRLIQNIFNAQPNRKESKWDGDKERYVFLEALHAENEGPIAIRSQALNMLLAGRDTTASLLSWLFYMLARHPPVCRKLREAILTEFGTYDLPQPITFEKLKSCRYLQQCLNETLRLCPPIPVNARVAVRDTMLPHGGGPDRMAPIYINKGEVVVYSVQCMHRRKDLWGDDAEEFKPDRWAHYKHDWYVLDGGSLSPLNSPKFLSRRLKFERPLKSIIRKFLPFNGGPRVCLGQQFALVEASYVIVRLLQRFDQLESVETRSTSKEPLSVIHMTPKGFKIRCHLAQG